MSTILEALKKAEKESSERLKAEPVRPARIVPRKSLVAGVVVLGIAGGLWIGYIFSGIPRAGKGGSTRAVRGGGALTVEPPAAPAEEAPSGLAVDSAREEPSGSAPLDRPRGLQQDKKSLPQIAESSVGQASGPVQQAPIESEAGAPRPAPRRETRYRAAVDEKPGAPSLTLSGVIYDPVRPMAIINGRLVGHGDSVGGAKILRIGKESVRISFEGGEGTIRIKK